MKNKNLWLTVALAGGMIGMSLAKQRRQERVEAWDYQAQRRSSHTALVTGASSGIGEAYARKLASQGFKVILVARRVERLKTLATEFRQHYGVDAEILAADLTTEAGISRVEQRISNGNEVDFLVNNAGYGTLGKFVDVPIEQTLALINCHTLASVRFCRAALPGMIERRHGAIVNLSSVGAFIPKTGDATYVSSKAYLNIFSESLAKELAGQGIRIQALCPGFTLTEFHDAPKYVAFRVKERIPRWAWMTSEEVVDASLQSIAEGQVICIPGVKNQLIVALARNGLSGKLLDLLQSFFPQKQLVTPARLTHEVLACPACHGPLASNLTLHSETLHCAHCQKDYPVVNGIPHFIEAKELSGMNQRFAHMYDWMSWGYRAFSKIAFVYIGIPEEQARREITDRLEPNGGRVLEVSVGPGVNLPYLVGRPDVGEVYGLDISTGQLQRCRSFIARKGWDVELHLGNAELLPYPDNTFESVFHIGGINFFNDKQKAIEEMIRVAKPGTRILICDENEKGAQAYEQFLPSFKRTLGEERQAIVAPVDLLPPGMEEVRVFDVWNGWMYCLEFRKPSNS